MPEVRLIDADALLKYMCGACLNPEAQCIQTECYLYREKKRIEAAPAVNRWIPVEDALPEKDKSYITYAETTKYCNHNEIPEELRINILYFNGEEWYDEECIYYNVTHWMPLPSTEGLT
jgi:hypothetical protein